MGCLGAEEGGRVLGMDLKPERRKKMEWGIWKKYGCCVLGRHSGGKKEEKAPCLSLINLSGNSSD